MKNLLWIILAIVCLGSLAPLMGHTNETTQLAGRYGY